MGKWEFYDGHEEVDHDEQEPSFSFYDFKKWLDSNENSALTSFRENVENKKPVNEDKDSLKEAFKKKIKDKVQRNIDKKLAERKKKN